MPSARPDIDGRPHERTGAGNSAEKRSGHVAHTLPDKLPIAVVMRSGDVVGDERCREGVYRPKEGKLKRSGDDEFGIGKIETGDDEVRQAAGYIANGRSRNPEDGGDDRERDESDERRRNDGNDTGQQESKRDRGRREQYRARMDTVLQRSKGPQNRDRIRGRRVQTRHREDLLNDDDDADARHQAGDHRIGQEANITSEPCDPEHGLQCTGKNEDAEDVGEIHLPCRKRVRGDDACRDQRHRRGRTGHLNRSPAHKRGNNAQYDAAIQAGGSAQSGGNPERKTKRQRHNAGGQATENIAAGNCVL